MTPGPPEQELTRPGSAAAPLVGSTDAWKLAGLILIVADHVGLFFAPDVEAWRVVGRCAAPIFFFLIGFARTRAVPWTWLALGAGLTATDHLTSDDPSETVLNILLNFALLRAALPAIEAWIVGGTPDSEITAGERWAGRARIDQAWIGQAWRTALLVAVFAALIPAVDPHLEYGTEGWLWALFGLWQRLATERPGTAGAWLRNGAAAAAALLYAMREIGDHEFEGVAALALALCVAGLALALTRFRRSPLRAQPSPALAWPLVFAGRRSLEIYGVSLFLMQMTAYAIEPGTAGNHHEG